MKTMVTGTTRDGTFLIENGKIKSAVKNMRIGQSILEAFSNVEMMTRQSKLCPQFGVVMDVPAMKIGRFNFIELFCRARLQPCRSFSQTRRDC